MELKFYLNKFVGVDNIEGYALPTLYTLRQQYADFLEKTEGHDPAFPMSNFGNKNGGNKVSGKNIHSIEDDETINQIKEKIERRDFEGNVIKPEKPESKPEYYKDKREGTTAKDRALAFLKNVQNLK